MNIETFLHNNINYISKILFLFIIFKLSLFQYEIINSIPFNFTYILFCISQLIEKDIEFLIYYGLFYFIINTILYIYKKEQYIKHITNISYITITIFILLNYLSIKYMNRNIYLNDIININLNNLIYIINSINLYYLFILFIPYIIYKINFNKYFLISVLSIYFICYILSSILITNKYNVYNKSYVTDNNLSNLLLSVIIQNKNLNNIDKYEIIKIDNLESSFIPKIKKPNNIFIFSLESINHKYFTKDNMPFLYSLLNHSIVFNNLYTNFPYTKDSLVNLYLGKNLEFLNTKYNNFLNIEYDNNPLILNEFKSLGYNLKFDTSSISSLNGSFFDKQFFDTYFKFNNFNLLSKYNKDIYKENESLDLVLSNIKDNDMQGYLTSINHWPYYTFNENDLDKTKDLSLEKYILSLKKLDNIYKELFNKYPILYNSLILFVADHGQGFNEHNFKTHNELYNEVLHIPGFIYHKDFEQLNLNNYYSQSNLLPTILSILKNEILNDSIYSNKLNRFIISTNGFKVSAIDRINNMKYHFYNNDCFKYDLIKDYNEKNKINCLEEKDDLIIKMIFNHIKRK